MYFGALAIEEIVLASNLWVKNEKKPVRGYEYSLILMWMY